MFQTDDNPNDKQSQSQNAKISQFLKNGNRITPLEALNQFGCMRLAARIKNLRDDGYAIQDEFIKLPNGKRVKQYFMAKKIKTVTNGCEQ